MTSSYFKHKIGYPACEILFCFVLVVLFSCSQKSEPEFPLFKALSATQTEILFENKLLPTEQFNLFSYMYYYNGAGVGAGDFNNDGLIDLFFAANQGNNKLYLNQGKLKFKDVTLQAEVPQDGGWSTGVSVIDINNDGLLDIYVCKVGHYKILKAKNQLLICKGVNKDGIPVYKDEAQKYGLDFSGFSTQAAFFDYDGDADLDMFLLNHSVNHDGNFAPRINFQNTVDSLAGQRLYRNDNTIDSSGNVFIKFTNVTKQSGIHSSRIGYGLGVAVSDINLDGWPDFYVGNDFHENDYLYINQKNGTFLDETTNRLMHTSQFSMGVDIADVNNDAFPEIISMDMLPYDPYILRRSLGEDDYTIFFQKIGYGYNYQYARNNLQYNRRNGMFSETGFYSGVFATDWSWATLWMDFDNDGNKDLFISNGIPKRMNDIDYINFISNVEIQQKLRDNKMGEQDLTLINKFPEIKIPNKFYHNKGNMLFEDIADSIGSNQSTFSNGAVYADLDNDGDLDIVVNNINDKALIYENTATNNQNRPYTAVKLKGPPKNLNAIGAKIILFTEGQIRTYENNPVHGFLSSMLLPLHIGLYKTRVDSAFLVWPDNTCQPIELNNNQSHAFAYKANLQKFEYEKVIGYYKKETRLMEDITASLEVSYRHQENHFNEFDREPLIPHMVSTEGPALAIADINHDGLEDIFIGASKTFHNAVFLQQAGGKFLKKEQPGMLKDSMWENVDAVWADVNNDNHTDLILASGGNEYYGENEHLLPLLYLNDGTGSLKRKVDAFENIYVTQSSVSPHDFNGDGFVDLFIGGRVVPWAYGEMPRSYLLQNDGTGKFFDVTEKFSKELLRPGMITHAKWEDINNDQSKDLLVSYEWDGIDVFLFSKNKVSRTKITGKKGWWNFVLPVDIDKDGDIDLIAGNLGLNNRFKTSEKQPLSLYYNDFDENGKKEQVLTHYMIGEEIPFATKMELEKQMPGLKKNFLYAEDFAKASLPGLLGADKLKQSQTLTADYFSNTLLLNNGNMRFESVPLPWEAQLTCYRDAIVVNANNDDLPDILLTGNFYENNIQRGRYDADFGTILLNKGKGIFACETMNGVQLKGQVRRIRKISIGDKEAFVLARNNDSTMVIAFDKNHSIKRDPSLKKQDSKF